MPGPSCVYLFCSARRGRGAGLRFTCLAFVSNIAKLFKELAHLDSLALSVPRKFPAPGGKVARHHYTGPDYLARAPGCSVRWSQTDAPGLAAPL